LGAFGEKLRKQREQRGISLDAISTTTKISPRMLRAIEDEHFDQLPGGVFNKGFVRAYARQVGLDEEETVSDYLAALRESQVQSQAILPSFRNSAGVSAADAAEHTEVVRPEAVRRNPNVNLAGKGPQDQDHGNTSLRSNRLGKHEAGDSPADRRTQADDRRKEARRSEDREVRSDHVRPHEVRSNAGRPKGSDEIPSSPLSFLNLTSGPSSPQLSADSDSEQIGASASVGVDQSSRRVPWGKLATALIVITLTLGVWSLRRRSQIAAPSQLAVASPASPALSSPTPPSPTPANHAPGVALPVLASTKPSAVSPSLAGKHSSPSTAPANQPAASLPDADANPPVEKPHAREATPKPPLSFTLLIRADQTSWVSISADGQPVAQETLIAPANTSVRASHEIIVKAGNSAGISFLLNGKEIPTHGNPGEVRTFIFDANGLRASAEPQPPNSTR
jgi:transcriptional regulator with XRE-family HTH domain